MRSCGYELSEPEKGNSNSQAYSQMPEGKIAPVFEAMGNNIKRKPFKCYETLPQGGFLVKGEVRGASSF